MKKLIDFFYYTKSERKACMTLLLLCIAQVVLLQGWDFSPQYPLERLAEAPQPILARRNATPTFQPFRTRSAQAERSQFRQRRSVRLFDFDPNTVSAEALQTLGLPEYSANIWIKYRSKGGRFREAEDVLKIYGLPTGWFEQVRPYLHIEAPANKARDGGHSVPVSAQAGRFAKPCTPIDINMADTAAWQQLRGIGRVLAARIIKFRTKLGGFYAVEQVRETYGLADSVFQHIQPCLSLGQPQLKPLVINELSLNELATHPYIGYKAARGILSWRDQHGALSSLEDLQQVLALEPQQLAKLKPYLRF